jgi:hypothetical protein
MSGKKIVKSDFLIYWVLESLQIYKKRTRLFQKWFLFPVFRNTVTGLCYRFNIIWQRKGLTVVFSDIQDNYFLEWLKITKYLLFHLVGFYMCFIPASWTLVSLSCITLNAPVQSQSGCHLQNRMASQPRRQCSTYSLPPESQILSIKMKSPFLHIFWWSINLLSKV